MTLQEIFGNELYTDIRNQVITECSEFINQSEATKLALVNKLKVENSIMKHGIQHLIDILDDVAAKKELLEKKINYYLQAYGEK
jgi:hypothetical protein